VRRLVFRGCIVKDPSERRHECRGWSWWWRGCSSSGSAAICFIVIIIIRDVAVASADVVVIFPCLCLGRAALDGDDLAVVIQNPLPSDRIQSIATSIVVARLFEKEVVAVVVADSSASALAVDVIVAIAAQERRCDGGSDRCCCCCRCAAAVSSPSAGSCIFRRDDVVVRVAVVCGSCTIIIVVAARIIISIAISQKEVGVVFLAGIQVINGQLGRLVHQSGFRYQVGSTRQGRGDRFLLQNKKQ